MEEEKSNNGRPTLYKEEYCKTVIELAKNGIRHMYRVAVILDVCYDTLHGWTQEHPKFFRSYYRARTIQIADLMDDVINGMKSRDFNANAANVVLAQFNIAIQRMLQIDGINADSLIESGQAILKAVEKGKLTADELQKSVNAIAQLAKVEEVTELRDKIKQYEELSIQEN